QEHRVGFDTSLELLPSVMDRDGAVEVALRKVIVEEDNDGSGFGIGSEVVGIVPDHSAKAAQRVRRKNVRIGNDAHRFEVIAILTLSNGLLDLFVGNVVDHKAVAEDETETVPGREIALVVDGKISRRSVVGVIF